jgi:translation initiation factor 2 beta subunit (eIF-2beta)/eIF-5
LLNRIVDIIKEKHGENMGATGTFKLIEPKCSRTKTKSTWNNFDAQASAISRDHQHILTYFMTELGCEGNIGSSNEMVLVGGYQPKHFLRLIRKYIEDYVRCINCKGLDTKIERDEKSRLFYLHCNKCQSARTVQTITGRYQATKRGQRRKERM